MNRPRLFLVTPPSFDTSSLADKLRLAFRGGDIACVLIYMPDANTKDIQAAAQALVPIIQEGGAAALVYRDTQAAGRSGADGVHVDTSLEDVKLAVESFQPDRIVGTGGTKQKHDSMEWAETGVDYIFFGKLDLDEKPDAHAKTINSASWWAELFETPCVAMAGQSLESVEEAAGTGADFVAIKDAAWQAPGGIDEVVANANRILEKYPFPDAD
ncbi:thiamine phosphate synthase [Roseibium denhamense]|uniref:Thiamine-phosphate diphosphorylase n=1 Tax=Roseibium denhamense TaxID=76305 RepID=A0ABY1NJR6_9HYPH|nr:thiamine phosphate synthase [Roseibium denhamense]MTI06792.1 thiamine phosphate synthase [Roseibium denhamense]SMP11381.1 thiamine-phosphate diphosphorylase [Roseibium denhamense]